MRFGLSLLISVLCCAPAFVSRQFERRRWWWLVFVCAAIGGVILWSGFPAAAAFYAVLLGGCIFVSFCSNDCPGKKLRFCYCWGMGMAILCSRCLFSSELSFVSAAAVLIVSAGFSSVSYWMSKWSGEDAIVLSDEKKASPMTLLIFLLCILLMMTGASSRFSVACAWIAVAAGIVIALTVALWNDMFLAVSHSLASSRHRMHCMDAIDRANRNAETEVFRQLAECRNRISQLQLAYSNQDMQTLSELFAFNAETHRRSYTPVLLLDAILRNRAIQMEQHGMRPDFFLQIDSIKDYSLSDIGVIMDIMLDMLSESHGFFRETVKLRVQIWNSMLILTAGRKTSIHSLPETKRETLRQIAEEYHGWFEIADQGQETRISVVLHKPAEKQSEEKQMM